MLARLWICRTGGRTVAPVVGEPAVIREVIQGVVAGQVLGVLVHKL